MKNIILLLTLILATSCNLKEKLEEVRRINTDLEEAFGHHEIDISIQLGTQTADNHLVVTFFNYDLDNKAYRDLHDLASKARKRVIEKNPEFKNLDNIEVRFTNEKDSEDLEDFVVFKHKSECKE